MLSKLLLLRRTALSPTKTLVTKRWSGHNAMEIVPSSTDRLYLKNWLSFYLMITGVPIAVITTIINIRANPELTETPEGYEPRDWEYSRHPLTRLMAKYLYYPMEYEFELQMASLEQSSENRMMNKVVRRVKKVMKFYNDHRSMYYEPFYADYFRIGRDQNYFNVNYAASSTNEFYDEAYDADRTPIPVEGYVRRDSD